MVRFTVGGSVTAKTHSLFSFNEPKSTCDLFS
jgi:hypothetical protein